MFMVYKFPLYMCVTQTTLNRLKQPKNFYIIYICFDVTLHKEQICNPNFLNKLLNWFIFIWYATSKQANFVEQIAYLFEIFCRIIITPLYMCVTQTTLNRLKQPKHFYSVATETTGGEILVAFWPKHGFRSDLRVPNLKIFSWGTPPPPPPHLIHTLAHAMAVPVEIQF